MQQLAIQAESVPFHINVVPPAPLLHVVVAWRARAETILFGEIAVANLSPRGDLHRIAPHVGGDLLEAFAEQPVVLGIVEEGEIVLVEQGAIRAQRGECLGPGERRWLGSPGRRLFRGNRPGGHRSVPRRVPARRVVRWHFAGRPEQRVGTPGSQRCQLGGECGRVGVERFARKPTACFFDRLGGVQLVGREGNELVGNRGLGASDGSVVESDCGRRFGWGRGCVGGRGGQQADCDPQTQAGRRQRLRAARRESELPEGSLSELGPVGHDESVRRIRPCLGPSRSKSQRSSFHCDTFAGLNQGHRTVALVRGRCCAWPLVRRPPQARRSGRRVRVRSVPEGEEGWREQREPAQTPQSAQLANPQISPAIASAGGRSCALESGRPGVGWEVLRAQGIARAWRDRRRRAGAVRKMRAV